MRFVIELDGDRRSGFSLQGWDDRGNRVDLEGLTLEQAEAEVSELVDQSTERFFAERGS